MMLKHAFLFACSFALAACQSANLSIDRFRTDLPEYGLVKGPDGYYLSRQDGAWGQPNQSAIWFYAFDSADSAKPVWADHRADESDFYFSKETSTGCFISNRAGNADIWCLEWRNGNWTNPVRLEAPINSNATEFSPVLRPNGDIYFASDRDDGFGLGDLYRASRNGDIWTVENLGPEINTPGGEWNLEISPDGAHLIFEASHRETNVSIPGDLYIAERQNGKWGNAVSLKALNTTGSELMLRYIDEDTVVFAQSSGGDADLVLIDAADLHTGARK